MTIKNKIQIEGARILFRNFSGKEGQFNPVGRRNFCVLLDEELAKKLEEDGWNVRWLRPRDDQEAPQGYLQVAVRFDKIPPKLVMITSRGKTDLDADSVGVLDWAEITHIDLIIRPYNWAMHEGTRNERRGVKAHVQSMYITIAEDAFADKYYDVPDSASGEIEDDDVPIR